MSKVFSISTSELSETGEIGQIEDREIGSFGWGGGAKPRAQLGRASSWI